MFRKLLIAGMGKFQKSRNIYIDINSKFKFDIDIIIYKLYSRPRILEHGSVSVSKNKSKIELGLERNNKKYHQREK